MKNYGKVAVVALMSIMSITSCSKDETEEVPNNGESYDTSFKITDAPIDNANIQAVFVTIADVKVDGTSLDGFAKTTVELSALISGQTETLGNMNLQAGSYSDIELVLDNDTDAMGNTPGSYVELANGSKDKLEAASNSIQVADTYEVIASNSNEVIIDFDLRKTIKEEQSATSSDFEFVTMAELSAGIRAINKQSTGKISGTANDAQDTSDMIVVYAYEKGSFTASETEGRGESNIAFANAVTSAAVNTTTGSYSLNFLSEGEYELVFVSYNKNGDKFFFNSLLEAESAVGLDLGAISVSSTLQISANVTITGTK